MIAMAFFVGANVHRTRDRAQSALFASYRACVLAVWLHLTGLGPSSGGLRTNIRFIFHAMVTKAPLATHFFESAQRKLTESEHGFDDAEHWFRVCLRQGIERPAFRAPSANAPSPRPASDFLARAVPSRAFLQRWMMRLSAHGISGSIPACSQASTFAVLK